MKNLNADEWLIPGKIDPDRVPEVYEYAAGEYGAYSMLPGDILKFPKGDLWLWSGTRWIIHKEEGD